MATKTLRYTESDNGDLTRKCCDTIIRRGTLDAIFEAIRWQDQISWQDGYNNGYKDADNHNKTEWEYVEHHPD